MSKSKIDLCELLQFLGIPAKKIADGTVRTISGWNWRDLAFREPTWTDLATAYEQASEKSVTFSQDPRQDPRGWFYREDQPRNSVLASISPVKGEPDIKQFLQRCGLLTADVEKAIQCYEQKALPPQGVLRKLAKFPLAMWNEKRNRFDAVDVKYLTLAKAKPDGELPRGTQAVLAELTNGQKVKRLAFQTEKKFYIPGLSNSIPEAVPVLRPENGKSRNFYICSPSLVETVRNAHPNTNIIPVHNIHELPVVVKTLKSEDVRHVRLDIGNELIEGILRNSLVATGIVKAEQIDKPAELEKQQRTSAVRSAAAELGYDI